MTGQPTLKRSISLFFLIFYGLGTMVGGGIYALLGKVAGEAGLYAPIAFALAGLLALLSAVSYSELSARFPVSAGEARYVEEGFSSPRLAQWTGWLVILTGIVSAATLSVATIGFLQDLVHVPEHLSLVLLVVLMGGVAAWGIGQSIGVVSVITAIELGALVFLIYAAGNNLQEIPERLPELLPSFKGSAWIAIIGGSFLAFYAFIGFEDMVNVAEEVKNVKRNLPLAIMICVVLATLLYVTVALVAILAATPEELAESNTPMATIVGAQGKHAMIGLGLVSLLTGLNGALVQIIMASRVAYGLAGNNQAPKWMGLIHPRTRTPLYSTGAITGVILLLALFFPLAGLAKTTSAIILLIFAFVNLSLWRVKRINPDPTGEGPRVPAWLPLLGGVACLMMLLFQGWIIIVGE